MQQRVGTHSRSRGTVMVLGGDGFCGWPTSLYPAFAG